MHVIKGRFAEFGFAARAGTRCSGNADDAMRCSAPRIAGRRIKDKDKILMLMKFEKGHRSNCPPGPGSFQRHTTNPGCAEAHLAALQPMLAQAALPIVLHGRMACVAGTECRCCHVKTWQHLWRTAAAADSPSQSALTCLAKGFCVMTRG